VAAAAGHAYVEDDYVRRERAGLLECLVPVRGLAHNLDVGAKRLVDGVTDPTLSSGVFYASAANKLKGPLVDQADIFPDLANPLFQDHANEAIHRFIS